MGNARDTGYLQNIVTYDANDNIVLPADLSIGGSGGFYWDNTNKRLGIGTATPDSRIHAFVSSGSIQTLLKLENASATASSGTKISFTEGGVERAAIISQINTGTTPYLSFENNGAERWRITSTGILQSNGAQAIQTSTGNLTLATAAGNGHILLIPNGTGDVGVGTITPNAILTSANTGALTLDSNDGNHTGFGLFIQAPATLNTVNSAIGFGNSTGRKYAAIGMQTYADADQVGLNFYVQPTASGSSGILTEAMRIFSNGNVGINTGATDNGQRLQVSGEGRFYQPLTSTTSYLTVENNRSRNAAVKLKTTIGDFLVGVGIGTDTNQFQIYDNTAGANRLTINSTGAATFSSSVGVGGASATYPLTAYNASNGTTAAFGGTARGIRIDNDGTFSSGRSTIFGVDSSFYGSYQPLSIEASSLSLQVISGGNVGIGTASPNANSRLHVYRGGGSYDTIIADGDAGTNAGFAIYEGGSARYALYSNGAGGNDSFNIYNFGAAGNSFTIYTSGNVGINSSSDNGARLQVNGNATLNGPLNINGSYIRGKTITGTANGTDVIFGVFLGFPGGIAGTVEVFAMAGIIGGGSISSRVLTFNFAGGSNQGGSSGTANVSNSVLGSVASPNPGGTNIDSLSASITSQTVSSFNISISNSISGSQITAPTYYIQVTYGLHGQASIS